VFKEENEAVIQAFLAAENAAQCLPPAELGALPPSAEMLQCGIQLLPGNEAETDGFYYAAVTKVAKAQHS
jgi:16S rRNA C967 or C1407 C5-methylase (RsmB/RsmF family)